MNVELKHNLVAIYLTLRLSEADQFTLISFWFCLTWLLGFSHINVGYYTKMVKCKSVIVFNVNITSFTPSQQKFALSQQHLYCFNKKCVNVALKKGCYDVCKEYCTNEKVLMLLLMSC